MDKVKAFFAQDWAKIVFGGLYVIASGLLVTVVPDGPTKTTLLTVWSALVTPLAIYFGITSGGTSNLNSTASQARAAVVEKIAPK
jgi:hypothetical protein